MLYEPVVRNIDRLLPADQFKPFPVYADRDAWEAVSGPMRAYYRGAAHGLGAAELPVLKATRYMDFFRDGNRKRYEDACFARRNRLLTLTLAECIDGGGAYLDDIIDHIWAICEETTWVVPAHNDQKDGVARELCDIEAPVYIDLFSAETGSVLTWVYYFLADEIAKRAPLVKRRIQIEVKRRILDPYLADDSFWWKGFGERKVNNWNPWINSNVLPAFLILEADEKRRREGVLLSAKSAQAFIDVYEPDGGCDEGPGYFGVAGASLLDYLEIIGAATGGAVDLYGEPLIRNMSAYICCVHIAGRYFVNFADAAARISISSNLLERTGRRIGDEDLAGFARFASANGLSDLPCDGGARFDGSRIFRVHRTLAGFFTHEAADASAAPYHAPKEHLFEGIQVMITRMRENCVDGIFLAAKGGHNSESHNHNDVGNFILYADGAPVLIDAGVETYTKKTFSEQRYEIWTMRSDYHNLPTINGQTQIPGIDAAAYDFVHSGDGNVVKLSLDIGKAYPAEAVVNAYRRELVYDRAAQTVSLTDQFDLERAVEPIVMNLLCYNAPKEIAPGRVDLGGLTLAYDAKAYDYAVDPIELTDPKIRNDWQIDTFYRIRLTGRELRKEGNLSLRFSR